jgi:sterol desaturase/sphingolipid hydroxylase (fatty acid hydroxylase superfamily)
MSDSATLARVTIFPALVVAIGAAALWVADVDLALLGLAEGARQALFGAVLGTFYALIALLERRLPYRADWSAAHGDVRTDVAHLVFTALGSSQIIKITWYAAAFAAAAWLSRRLGVRLWPLHWPLVAQLALALLLAELGHYAFHRLSHEHPLVWRLHATHHSAPRLYWLNATRFHPFDLLCLIVCQTAPLILLGIDDRAMLAYGAFSGVYRQLQHANIDVRTGPLRWLFSTPDLHRWHHSDRSREGNSNYGAVLSSWDVLFGTFFYPGERRRDGRVGIGTLPNFPQRYLAQLASPFRWAAVRRAL